MDIVSSLQETPAGLERTVVTIGNFDGVHRGHQELFRRMVQSAKLVNGTAVVLTFNPHPLQVLRPDNPPKLMTPLDVKIRLISQTGADFMIIQPFTRDFSRLSAQEFLTRLLVPNLRPVKVIVGHNFRFGRDKGGGTGYLKDAGRDYNFEIDIVPPIRDGENTISSSAIRAALTEGNAELTRLFLGRPYCLEGIVVQGENRGRHLGFPTANLQTNFDLIPADGVYACFALSGGRVRRAVVNIGFRPTFDGANRTIEIHILDFSGDLYGKQLELQFVTRIRPELKFASPEDLITQIKHDINITRAALDQTQPCLLPPIEQSILPSAW